MRFIKDLKLLAFRTGFLWLLRPLYHFSYWVLRYAFWLSFGNYGQIWCRNSYLFGYFNPGVSDIDFTIVLNESDKSLIQSVKRFYGFFRCTFLFFGEINFYVAQDIFTYIHLCNPYELDRDPFLKTHFKLDKTNNSYVETSVQAFVYMLRLVESDVENITEIPEIRKAKWSFHFSQIGYEFHCHESLVVQISRYLNDVYGKDISPKVFNKYLHRSQRPSRHLTRDDDFFVLFPHLWLTDSLHLMSFEEDIHLIIPKLTKKQYSIFLAQVQWEAWGVYGQLPGHKDLSGVSRHFNNFLDIINYMDPPEELKSRFEKLKKDLLRLKST